MGFDLRVLAVAALFAATSLAGCGKSDTNDTNDTNTSGDTDTDTNGGDTDTNASCQTDVCATYGAAVPKVASDIVDRAASDPEFQADFAPVVAGGDARVTEFKTNLTNFITDAYGCTTGAYTGPSMVDAHTGLNITQTEYDDFITLVAGVLADNGVPADDINQCFAPPLVDPAFEATIIGH